MSAIESHPEQSFGQGWQGFVEQQQKTQGYPKDMFGLALSKHKYDLSGFAMCADSIKTIGIEWRIGANIMSLRI